MRGRSQLGQLEWSDLRLVLSICRAGSLSGAARLLECDHSTVFRNINRIEKSVGVRFFERLPTGYAMTDAGELARTYGERVEAEMHALSREVLGRDDQLQGNVCVTAPSGLVSELLPEWTAEFITAHPQVSIELLAGAGTLDLGRREADLAIRATSKPPEGSVGRKICRFRFGIYCAPERIEAWRHIPPPELDWVFLDGIQSWLVPHVFKSVAAAEERIIARTNTPHSALQLAATGLGATFMSCYFADRHPGLVRLGDPLEPLTIDLWVLTHPALRHTARVKALMRFLTDKLTERSALFEGLEPRC